MTTLPKIDQPLYSLTLPYTKKTIQYRPFLVKEEKILLLAAQGKDQVEITFSIYQVVRNCIVNDNIKIEDLPAFEIDLLFLNMRAKSIGDKVEQEFTCNNLIANDTMARTIKCGHVFVVPLSVSDVIITPFHKEFNVKLSEKMGVMMKYPKFRSYDTEKTNVEYDILMDCLDKIYDTTETYSFQDQSPGEIIEWIESLTKEQFNKIQYWYDSIPKLEMIKKFKCAKCGFEHEMNIEDPLSFF